jgi:small subunit ribosomal protein S18
MSLETAHKSSKTPAQLTYLDTEALSRFVTGTGKILPRRITRLTAKEHRHITSTIKHARNMLLMK